MKKLLVVVTTAATLFGIAMPAVAAPDPTSALALCAGQVDRIAQYGIYALMNCDFGQTGGEIAASYSASTSKWHVVVAGGGTVDSKYLVAKGVPLDAATFLVGAIVSCPPSLRKPLPKTTGVSPHTFLCLEDGPPASPPPNRMP